MLRQVGYLIGALALVGSAIMAGGRPAFAQDRLLGMVEPVTGKKPYRIGYASIDMNADFFLGVAYGVVDEAKKANVDLVRIVSAGGYGKVAEQVGQLEQLGALDVDAVILLAVAFDGFDKVIDRLVAKGVKVIALGTPVSSNKVSLGILQNQQQIGETIAAFACERKPKGEVITLPGPAGSEWNKMRFDGVKSGAEKCGMRLVGNTFEGQISIEDGQRQTADMLVKYPDADYLYAVAGIFGVGAAQQIQKAHGKPKVLTSGFTRRTVDLMREGTIALTTSEPPIVFGRAAVQYAVRVLNGDPLPKLIPGIMPFPITLVPTVAVTAENVGKYDVNLFDLAPEGWTPSSMH